MLASPPPFVRVLVVDDSPAFRMRVKQHLAADPVIEVVGEVDNGADALREIEQLGPDVVLLDLSMPPPDGFSVLRTLKGRHDGPKVVVLTSDGSAMIQERCDALRADAILEKGQASDLLIPTLRRIATTARNRMITP